MNHKIRKDETLHAWVERLAPMCVGMDAEALEEVLSEVSRTSYIRGANAVNEIKRKYYAK